MPKKTDLQLVQGTLDALALKALDQSEMHGYAVAQWIRSRSAEELRVEDGALYTCLHRLEKQGWITARWGVSDRGRRAKFYRLTAAGRRQVVVEVDRIERYVRALFRVLGTSPLEGGA